VTDPTSLPSFGGAPDQNVVRGLVFEILHEEGYRPWVDEDGDIAFRAQGHQLFARCRETVPALVRVMGQWVQPQVPGGELTRLRAANAVGAAMELIKVTVVDEIVVVMADFIVSEVRDLRPVLHPAIEAVLESMRAWHSAAQEYGAEYAAASPDRV
jgi:hypothetical protein